MSAILGASQLIQYELNKNYPEIFHQLRAEMNILQEAGQDMTASIHPAKTLPAV